MFDARILAAILSLPVSVTAWADGSDHAPVDPANIGVGHPTGHLHDRADQTWPPQPRGIQNVVLFSNPGNAERTADLKRWHIAERERIALARGSVRKALGRRYTRPDLVEADRKGAAGDEPARLLYFSHENNTTVEVTLDKTRVRSLRRIAPSDYQPDVTDEEIVEAEAIARAHFNNSGQARVAALKSYGILAHLPEGTGFYPTRVIYLSFHEAPDTRPEFAAWVDLTNRQVVRIREERP
ncbi:MAG: hypothetical protein Q8N51_06845 [Gammaproteobacteria bacterium]|nr:hypothetical protein [Gammaproteobacteria bacterium]